MDRAARRPESNAGRGGKLLILAGISRAQPLDLIFFLGSLLAILAVGYWTTQHQKSSVNDYFRGGRRLPWDAIGFSIIAAGINSEQFDRNRIRAAYGGCFGVVAAVRIGREIAKLYPLTGLQRRQYRVPVRDMATEVAAKHAAQHVVRQCIKVA
jgi:hypothetical protein